MKESILISIAGVGLIGIACQWLAWRVHLPAILPLLISGIIIGPVLGWLNPDLIFGDLLFPLISICVAIILFEGSLTLHLKKLRGLESTVRNLITIGTAITGCGLAYASWQFAGIPIDIAMLFGAIAVVTGPTVIVPMLRAVRPSKRVSQVLLWEGIIIDPIGALLAVLIFDFVVVRHEGGSGIVATLSFIIFAGIMLGVIAGLTTGFLLKRHYVPQYLRSFLVLMVVVGVYTVADVLAEESGLLAVTIMGITMANTQHEEIEDIATFKEHISLLLISVLFILLAARIDFSDFAQIGFMTVLGIALLSFPVRAISVLASTIGSSLIWRERALLCWLAPRGIVAAAVSAVFALKLEAIGHPDAQLLVPLVLSLIIVTVIVQGSSAGMMARWLGVAEPAPTGALILGANFVCRNMAAALQQQDVPVLLCDTDWDNIHLARMQNINVYYGNILSEHANDHVDLTGIGKLLAISGRPHLNSLAAVHFRGQFGSNQVYELPPSNTKTQAIKEVKHSVAQRHRGRKMLTEGITFDHVAQRIREGQQLKATQLTEEFSYSDYNQQNQEAVQMFALDKNKQLHIFTTDSSTTPGPGWTVISLMPQKENSP